MVTKMKLFAAFRNCLFLIFIMKLFMRYMYLQLIFIIIIIIIIISFIIIIIITIFKIVARISLDFPRGNPSVILFKHYFVYIAASFV